MDDFEPSSAPITIDETSLKMGLNKIRSFIEDPTNPVKKQLAKIWLETLEHYLPKP